MSDQTFVKSDKKFDIEVCVQSLAEGLYAERLGASQIELCSHLDLDGLFPDEDVLAQCLEELNCHLKVMIRPKAGDFEYSSGQVDKMIRQIEHCHSSGVAEVVFGATLNGQLDLHLIDLLAKAAGPMKVTVHKAIDTTIDPVSQLERLIEMGGIDSVLTSGGCKTAWEGKNVLLDMKNRAAGHLTIIPAGKILPENIEALHRYVGASIYHGRNILGPMD